MTQLERSNRHRGEVIEVYEGGSKAAVRFSNGRIECVVKRGMNQGITLGERGMVDYVPSLNGYEWVFQPFKGS